MVVEWRYCHLDCTIVGNVIIAEVAFGSQWVTKFYQSDSVIGVGTAGAYYIAFGNNEECRPHATCRGAISSNRNANHSLLDGATHCET